VRALISAKGIKVTTVVALIPVLAAAVVNTGYQYLRALDTAGGEGASGWRDSFILGLGVDYQDPTIIGITVAGLAHVAPVLIIAMMAAGVCERAFATQRDRPMDAGFILSAIVFTLLMHPEVSLFHVAFAMMFGIVFGRGVFGGEGKTFLNPALLAAAVVQISFPTAHTGHPLWDGIAGYSGTKIFSLFNESGSGALASSDIGWWDAFIGVQQGMMGTTSTLAIALGGILLMWSRIASWRLVLGHVLGLTLAVSLFSAVGDGGITNLPWYWHAVLGSFAFGVVFVATDPPSAASTDAGRWIQGIVAGGLVVVMRVVNPSHPDSVVTALLMGSILAPLIDYGVVGWNIRQRRRRYG